MRSNRLWSVTGSSTGQGRCWLTACWSILTGALALGCASPRHQSTALDKADGLAAAQPPSFLSGPASVLLTNLNDYSANLTVSGTNGWLTPVSGNLFQQEGQLLFVRTSDESLKHNPWAGSFRFLWNVRSNSGLVISHALHGYTPFRAPTRYTRTIRQADSVKTAPEQMDGQSCQSEQVTVSSLKGEVSEFRIWLATELDGLPLQIISTAPTNAIVLRLTEPNPDRLSPELFSPPDGFVPYESIEAMVNALAEKPRVMPYTHESSEGRARRRR